MRKFKLRHADAPVHTTVMRHLACLTDWESMVAACGPRRFDPLVQVAGLRVNAPALSNDIAYFYQHIGLAQWRSQVHTNIEGASLSINPDHDPGSWIYGSFGHPRYQVARDYYSAVEQDQKNHVKGDYLDSLGFRLLHPMLHLHCPALVDLLQSFSVPVVRVTARTITGHRCYPSTNTRNTGGFHTDDDPFELLRVNVAIENDGTFGLEYEDGTVVPMASGAHAVVNTDIRHRVHIARRTLKARTHLVIGLAPWLTYDRRTDTWGLNEHAGVTHPYDMARRGLLIQQ